MKVERTLFFTSPETFPIVFLTQLNSVLQPLENYSPAFMDNEIKWLIDLPA
jgi:hypothetical protein